MQTKALHRYIHRYSKLTDIKSVEHQMFDLNHPPSPRKAHHLILSPPYAKCIFTRKGKSAAMLFLIYIAICIFKFIVLLTCSRPWYWVVAPSSLFPVEPCRRASQPGTLHGSWWGWSAVTLAGSDASLSTLVMTGLPLDLEIEPSRWGYQHEMKKAIDLCYRSGRWGGWVEGRE